MALVAASTAFPEGQAGIAFWAVLLLWAAIRRSRGMREPGANKKGFVAGFLLYGAWIITSLSGLLFESQQRARGFLVIGLALVTLVVGVCLAVLALVEIRGDRQRYTSGSAPAIRALVSAGIFCSLFGFGVWSGLNGRGERDEAPPAAASPRPPIERPEFNFRLKFPARPWVEMDAKKINSDATILLSRSRPELYFSVVAEKLADVEFTPEGMLETWKARLESTSPQLSWTAPRPTKVNGLPGMRASAVATVGKLELAYVNNSIVHNGFFYQLVAWSNARDEARLNREIDAIFAGFELIDPSRAVEQMVKPASSFTSRDFGYTINLGGKPWTEWRGLKEKVPRAEFGALCGERAAMAVYPVSLFGTPATDDEVDSALVSLLDLQQQRPVQRSPLQRGPWRGFDSVYERDLGGKTYRYRLWTLRAQQAAILAAEWRTVDAPQEGCSGAVEKLVLADPASISREAAGTPRGGAHFLNELGLMAFRNGKAGPARAAFQQAHALVPDEGAFVGNVVSALEREGGKQGALEWLVRDLKGAPCASPLRATEASLLADLGKAPEALATWMSLFGCGYIDDKAFDEYARFLEAHGKAELAVKEAASYADRHDSVAIALLRAELLSRKGEGERAIALLEGRQKRKGFDSTVAFRLGELALDAERPAETVRTCEEMVSRGFAGKDVFVLQARGEYRLKWYARAKISLERALKDDPSDGRTQRFLDHVSATLGEGKNSAIKDPIEPVPLPPSLADAVPEPAAGYSAAYLLRATALSFVRGKELRTTEYRRIRVADETGVSRFSTMEFRFDPLSEALFINRVVVTDTAGAVSTLDTSEAYVSDEASGELGTQRRTLFVPIPGLRPGSTIELVLTRRDLQPPDGMDFSEHQLAIGYPVGRSALFVRGDVRLVQSRTTPGLAPRQLPDGIAWVIERPPVYRWEPLQPPSDEYLPTVWLGDSADSWEAVGKQYLASLEKLLAPDAAVRDAARKLDRSAAGLARFVQKELTYKAIEFGRGARIPRPPADVLRRRYGDCKDHALLLHLLLRGAGIDSRLALVRTGGLLQRELPSLDQFDHMVVYLPGQGAFIDATAKSVDLLRGVPAFIAGKDALVLDPKQPRLLRIPEQGEDAGEMSLVREARLLAGGDLEVTETGSFRGNEAAGMRSYFEDIEPKSRQSAFQRRLSSHGGKVEVVSLEVQDLSEPQKPLTVQVKYVQRGAFHAVGGQLVGTLPALLERGRIEVEADQRETPFQFRLPLRIHTALSLQVPSGYAPAQPVATRAAPDGRFAEWRVRPEDAADRREVRASFDFSRRRGRHAASEYAGLRKETDTALAALEQQVVLQPLAVGRSD